MAPPHNNPLHLSLPPLPLSLSTEHHRRCSKAQMCFFNILHIISTFPSADVTHNKFLTLDDHIYENKDFVGDTVGENCVSENNDRTVDDERGTEHSEISHVGDQSSGIAIDYNGASQQQQQVIQEKARDEGNLSLLIEAAQLILGDESEPDKKPASYTITNKPQMKTRNVERNYMARGKAKKRQQCWTAAAEAVWYAEFEDTSPVVRSKRGRNQVLPFKYRDSVVHPLLRWTSTCKSSSNVPKRSTK